METLTLEKTNILTYRKLEAMMYEQDRLIAEGKIQRSNIEDDIFTPSEEYAFKTGKTFDEIITQYNLL
ncbi:MAG: hypothetical protein LBN23_03415 [Paludibacter sp.]|jgi:hypothetical protein|nr:hypothetical protein [Paludibacter sp.]